MLSISLLRGPRGILRSRPTVYTTRKIRNQYCNKWIMTATSDVQAFFPTRRVDTSGSCHWGRRDTYESKQITLNIYSGVHSLYTRYQICSMFARRRLNPATTFPITPPRQFGGEPRAYCRLAVKYSVNGVFSCWNACCTPPGPAERRYYTSIRRPVSTRGSQF